MAWAARPSAPGVYLRGLEAPAAEVLHSAVTAFVGIAERGPCHQPQRIGSWEQYLQVFGRPVRYAFLAESVLAFFLNGGERAVCVRVCDPTAPLAAKGTPECPEFEPLSRAELSTPVLDHQNGEALRIRARDEGFWGRRLEVDVFVDGSRELALGRLTAAAPAGTAIRVDCPLDLAPGERVRIQHASDDFLNQDVRIQQSLTNGDVTLSDPLDSGFPAGSPIRGRGFGLRVRLRLGEGDERLELEELFDGLVTTPTHPRHFARVVNGPREPLEYVERRRLGHSTLIRIEDVAGAFKPVAFTGRRLSGGGDGMRFAEAAFAPGLVLRARALRGSEGNGMRVRAKPFVSETALPVPTPGTGDLDRVAVRRPRAFRPLDPIEVGAVPDTGVVQQIGADELLELQADLTGPHPMDTEIRVPGRFDLRVERPGDVEPAELFDNLSADPGDPADLYWASAVNARATAPICVEPSTTAAAPPVGSRELRGGRDPGEIDGRFYSGYETSGAFFQPAGIGPDQRLGVATLESRAEVALVCVPDLARMRAVPGADPAPPYRDAQLQVLRHCQKMGDRLALLDTLEDNSLGDAEAWPSSFAGSDASRFGALYHPWVVARLDAGRVTMPASPFAAGAMAALDRRDGVSRAPANHVPKGVAGLVHVLGLEDQARLNPAGVNALRKFEDGAIRLYGARTLSPDPRHRWIHARRVLFALVKTLSTRLRWACFEPNDSRLWRRIEAQLFALAGTLVAKGMTASGDPERDFYVKCSSETNPPERRDRGEVVAELGIAVTAPSEFIQLTVQRSPESVAVVEAEV